MHLPLALFLSVCVSSARAATLTIAETASADDNLNTLVSLLSKAGVDILTKTGPYTVFAPTDAAFDKVDEGVLKCLQEEDYVTELRSVLSYHVTMGESSSDMLKNEQKIPTVEGSTVTVMKMDSTVTINTATVTTPNVVATNGIIHVIDEVLIPIGNAGVKALIDTCSTTKDIPGIADEKFKRLFKLLLDADLVQILSGDGPFTVFAPTDDAFAKLGPFTGNCLGKSANRAGLIALLRYHVISGRVASSTLKNGTKVETLEGSDATVTIAGTIIKINTANVTTPDVPASNGIIHEIDEVLRPPSGTAGVDAIFNDCIPKSFFPYDSASAILGVAIPLIGMVAAVVAIA